jgi:hypothetical protein
VREKSHIDDMRSAIRGDFERLAERRGGQELMRPASEQAEELADTTVPKQTPEASEAPAVEDVPANGAEEPESTREEQPGPVPIRHEDDAPAEPVSAELVTIRNEVAVDEEAEPWPGEEAPTGNEAQMHEEPPADEAPAPRRSWLDRLLGR